MKNRELKQLIAQNEGFKTNVEMIKKKMTEVYLDVMHLYKNIVLSSECLTRIQRRKHGTGKTSRKW